MDNPPSETDRLIYDHMLKQHPQIAIEHFVEHDEDALIKSMVGCAECYILHAAVMTIDDRAEQN